MRKKESELLRQTFGEHLGMRLVMVDARRRFLDRLTGVEDPGTRAHGANESLHLATFERACLAEALLLNNLGC